jgi:hypothetical protein
MVSSRLAIACILFSLGVAACVHAQSAAKETARISGKVTVKNKGVAGIVVALPNARVTFQALSSWQRTEVATTDREGKFQISDLAPLSYRVFAWLNTYTLTDFDEAMSTSHRVGDSVTVVMTKGGVITGAVTTQTGDPVVGVRVYARMIGERSYPSHFLNPYALERTTDDRGVYRIYGLATGTYVVWAGGGDALHPELDAFDNDVPTYAPASSRDTAAEISVRAGQETTNVDITYRGEPGHIVSGNARRPESSEPVQLGISLTAVGKSKSEWSLSTAQESDSKGFVFRGVDDGDYEITALSVSQAGQSAIFTRRIKVKGADVTGVELVTQPMASVSGRFVLEESKAPECAGKQRPLLSEALVSAVQDESEVVDYHPQFRWFLRMPVSPDAQGNVAIKNIVPGRYLFEPQFTAKYWYLQSITLTKTDAARTWTTVKSGDRLSGLTITLAQGAASLHGRLVLKEGETQPEGAFVYLVPAEREKALDVLRFFAAAVKADGKIALNNIAPGNYLVLVKSDTNVSSLTKLRSPDQLEVRAKLRREAEAANKTSELKACQNMVGFELNGP